MKTIIEKNGYRIDFNGSKTFFVIDSADQCRLATTSEQKAKNKLNSILRSAGHV